MTRQKKNGKKVTFYLSQEILERLEKRAAIERTSKSELLERAYRYLEQNYDPTIELEQLQRKRQEINKEIERLENQRKKIEQEITRILEIVKTFTNNNEQQEEKAIRILTRLIRENRSPQEIQEKAGVWATLTGKKPSTLLSKAIQIVRGENNENSQDYFL